MPVPNQFGTATSAIPLSQLDTNFNTPITIGNTAVQLGNTVTTLNNMTLANVTISSGTVTITNVAVTTANVSGTANISTLVVVGNETVGGNTTITGNITATTIKSTTSLNLYAASAYDVNLYTGSTNTARLSSNVNGVFTVGTQGNVGALGTDYGTIGAWGSAGGGLRIYRGTGAGTPISTIYADGTGVFVSGNEATPLVFSTNSTERARLNTSGAFVFAGGSTGANGIGITFPATQSASSNANTLDDYEEGTWSSAVSNTANVTGTGSLDRADYIKIGSLVTIVGRISGLTITTALTGTAIGLTLPFATKATDTVVMGSCRGSGTTEMIGIVLDATGSDATSIALNFPAAQVTANGVTTFSFSLTYIAA